MVKVEKDATGGNFLKATYVKEKKISELLIVNNAEIAEFTNDGKTAKKLQFKVNYQGFSKDSDMPDTWTLNSKCKNALIESWGDETDNWKGKPIPITLSGDGEYLHIMVDELRIK